MAYVPSVSTDNGVGCISTNGNTSCILSEEGFQLSTNLLTTPIVATFGVNGLSTTNPSGLSSQSSLNLNNNNITNANTITATSFVGNLSTNGLVYLSTGSFAITGSSSATSFSLSSVFNSTYKNYRIVLNPTTQVSSFTTYPAYSLTAFLGSGTLPTVASLFGFELTSNASSVVSPIYTTSASLSSAPLVIAVSQLTNHQTVIEVENVGYTATATQSIGIKCKSIYNNPGVVGASDRTISAVNVSGSTITGLTIQQSAISAGNNMTIGWTVYGYK